MYIEEQYVDKTNDTRLGESGLYESFTENIKDLFNSLQREFGRCVGSVYIDKNNKQLKVGWIFEKKIGHRHGYHFSKPYIQETWVILHKDEPTTKTTYHYMEL